MTSLIILGIAEQSVHFSGNSLKHQHVQINVSLTTQRAVVTIISTFKEKVCPYKVTIINNIPEEVR